MPFSVAVVTLIKFKLSDHVINWLFLILVEVLEITHSFRKSSTAWVISMRAKPYRDWDSTVEQNSCVGLGVEIGGVVNKFSDISHHHQSSFVCVWERHIQQKKKKKFEQGEWVISIKRILLKWRFPYMHHSFVMVKGLA